MRRTCFSQTCLQLLGKKSLERNCVLILRVTGQEEVACAIRACQWAIAGKKGMVAGKLKVSGESVGNFKRGTQAAPSSLTYSHTLNGGSNDSCTKQLNKMKF